MRAQSLSPPGFSGLCLTWMRPLHACSPAGINRFTILACFFLPCLPRGWFNRIYHQILCFILGYSQLEEATKYQMWAVWKVRLFILYTSTRTYLFWTTVWIVLCSYSSFQGLGCCGKSFSYVRVFVSSNNALLMPLQAPWFPLLLAPHHFIVFLEIQPVSL